MCAQDLLWPGGKQVWHLITGCHLCVGSTNTSDNAEACPNLTFTVERDVKPHL